MREIPGVPTWGPKSSAAILSKVHHLEAIPAQVEEWEASIRGARRLFESFEAHRKLVYLYRRLARLRSDVPLTESLDDLRWKGPQEDFPQLCQAVFLILWALMYGVAAAVLFVKLRRHPAEQEDREMGEASEGPTT